MKRMEINKCMGLYVAVPEVSLPGLRLCAGETAGAGVRAAARNHSGGQISGGPGARVGRLRHHLHRLGYRLG